MKCVVLKEQAVRRNKDACADARVQERAKCSRSDFDLHDQAKVVERKSSHFEKRSLDVVRIEVDPEPGRWSPADLFGSSSFQTHSDRRKF